MKLDSARELKQSIASQTLKRLDDRTVVRAFDLPAENLERVQLQARRLAVGVAPAGEDDYRLAVRLQSRLEAEVFDLESIRAQAQGEVDVQFVGLARKRRAPRQQQRQRPLEIGVSIGHFTITAGTIGAFVEPAEGSDHARVLSNNHVLANENDAAAGDAIIQPGSADGGSPSNDTVAELESFVPLDQTGPNLVDAALGSLLDGVEFDASTRVDIGQLAGTGDPSRRAPWRRLDAPPG